MFENKTILITGGTGSLGQALTKKLLTLPIKGIRLLSRNESAQVEMQRRFTDYANKLSFFIGDIRDYSRLTRALEDVDIVFHTAALKHVPVIEYNPFEAVKTNIIGTQNIIDACLEQDVEKVIGIGTDKAVSPLNTYGASKLLMEKIFVTAGNFMNPAKHRTKFITLRYGNVFGSSGSVIPLWINQIKNKDKISITDPHMTRFSIMMDEALDFILSAATLGKGSEIFVPKISAYTIMDLKNALTELLDDSEHEITGIRSGEKLHEILINQDEMRYSWEFNDNYVIFNPMQSESEIKEKYPGIKKVENVSEFSSNVAEKISIDKLKELISASGLL
jgi:UDP-N-acetylglucosamine 4,6-dehydratase/5-epimerase